MKLRKTTIFAILSLVVFYSCKKDTDVNMESFKIVKEVEKVTAGTTSATITGMYEYSGRIDGIKVRVGTSEQLFGSDVYVAEMSGKSYSANITGLRSGTKYHYRYEVDYGAKEDYLTEIYDFTTLSEAPTVKILGIVALNNDSTSFEITCKVEVDEEGWHEVTECGICWNNYQNGDPTLDDEKLPYMENNNPYKVNMKNLPTRTFYQVRAYAKNSAGTGFSEKESFRTGGEATTPKVSTVEVSDVTYNATTCLCNVSSDGGLELYERGVCWGLDLNPIRKIPAEGTEIGNYTVTIEGLNPNTDYHVRAYAINEKGIAYGEDLPFSTTDGKPTVTTSGITEITSTSAKGGGNVTDQGYSPVTERGICWSTSHEPMATGNHATSGTGTGSFICEMTDLTPNQTYYVRAYATNSEGTAYGDEVDFIAMEGLPSVETVDVTNVTTSGAKVNYKVTIEGGLEVDEHGICWSESNTIPTINDHYVSGGNGTGTFSVDLSGLNPGTKYYVRAYAKNEQGGEAYGTAKDFTTEATLPTVTTDGIEGTTAHGTVTADGGKPVTERGICWGLNHNPTTADLHDSNGTGLGSYAVPLTDLQPGKTYYYRAYATNEMGTAYGLEGPPLVVEANPPTVNTGEVSNIQQTTAQGSGNVTDGGGAEVTERGACWSTIPNPTIANSHADDGVGGLGNFTVPMTGLTANTHYYVRAYAKNREGKIGYGNQTDFTTAQSISAPTVTTTSPITNITQTTATGGGNVTNDGGSPVTERGICWSTSHNPTISGSHSSNGTGTGAYQVNMTGLTPGTTYYVRAYAKNNANLIGYGTEVQFTTQQQTTYTITVSANPTNGGTVSGGGTFNQGASCTVHAQAVTNYQFTNWTENGTIVSTQANYTFTVNGNRTLVANFTYNGGGSAPQGAIPGKFTIDGNGNKVYFSKGNMQYIGRASTPYWKFADNQWDYLGDNGQGSTNQNVDRDLFGWGTSGYNHGAVCYQPWSTSEEESDYYAYGNYIYSLYHQTGQADWGYNSINNGGNTINLWRTLSNLEWVYVFDTRSTLSGIRYAKAKVNNVNGVILLPDDWSTNYYSLYSTDTPSASFTRNTITASQWSTLEQHGAVFLPAAGTRGGTSIGNEGSYGRYWSASRHYEPPHYISNCADCIYFLDTNIGTTGFVYNSAGGSVRLVCPAEN